MSDTPQINCNTHGQSRGAFICHHLFANPIQPWICQYPDEETPFPDAWCESCEIEWQKHEEWTEAAMAFADIKLICEGCYEARHAESLQSMSDDIRQQWDHALETSCSAMADKQRYLINEFGLSKHQQWNYDQATGLLTFSNDGVIAVTAEFEILGSYSKRSKTWKWSWANFHMLTHVRSRVTAVRDWGEKTGFLHLTIPIWSADPDLCWHVASLAAEQLHAKGIYRAPTDNGYLYLAIMSIQHAG